MSDVTIPSTWTANDYFNKKDHELLIKTRPSKDSEFLQLIYLFLSNRLRLKKIEFSQVFHIQDLADYHLSEECQLKGIKFTNGSNRAAFSALTIRNMIFNEMKKALGINPTGKSPREHMGCIINSDDTITLSPALLNEFEQLYNTTQIQGSISNNNNNDVSNDKAEKKEELFAYTLEDGQKIIDLSTEKVIGELIHEIYLRRSASLYKTNPQKFTSLELAEACTIYFAIIHNIKPLVTKVELTSTHTSVNIIKTILATSILNSLNTLVAEGYLTIPNPKVLEYFLSIEKIEDFKKSFPISEELRNSEANSQQVARDSVSVSTLVRTSNLSSIFDQVSPKQPLCKDKDGFVIPPLSKKHKQDHGDSFTQTPQNGSKSNIQTLLSNEEYSFEDFEFK